MARYNPITIIYNPNSTGNGEQLAKEMQAALQGADKSLTIQLTPTKHAGHAEAMAYDISMKHKNPLIISASGDGGYHEVVNGIMRASNKSGHAVAGLLPAGNANDHYTSLHSGDAVQAILQHTEQSIDLLKITTKSQNKPLERYAHSYIGIGLTPKAGQELNKNELNWFNEIKIVLKVLLFLRPVRISVSGKVRRYDSLIFSNVSRMSKVIKLSKISSENDGKFEITPFRRRNKFALIGVLIRSSTIGLKGASKVKRYRFKTIKPTLVQLDGEVKTIDAGSDVIITIEPSALHCIV